MSNTPSSPPNNPNQSHLPILERQYPDIVGTVMAFDFGETRIGVAVGETILKAAHPVTTIEAESNDVKFAKIADIIKKQEGLGEKMKDGIKKGEKRGDGQKGQNGKQGKPGESGQDGEGGEGDAQAIMEIYKEQKQLREALQNELNKQGLGGNGQSALEQMKQIEKQLLNRGFKNETLQKILNVKQELLKLNSAIQQQGEENKRQSETNKKEFNNQSNALPAALLDYLNSIEILNRQSLPLRSNFNQKVQEYFNKK